MADDDGGSAPSRGGRGGKGSVVLRVSAECVTEEKGFFVRYTLFNHDRVTSSPIGFPEGEPRWEDDEIVPPAGATVAATRKPARAVKSYRLSKDHTLTVSDKEVENLNANPVLGVFVGRRGAGPQDAKANYLACLTLDMSALFTRTCCAVCVGALPWAGGGVPKDAFGKSATLAAGAADAAPLPAGGPGVGGPAPEG